MDEYNQGMDPEVKKYFKKIIRSFSYGLLWLMVVSTAGLFFGLGLFPDGFRWYNGLFYALSVIGFLLLIRYFYKTWNGDGD